MIIKSAAGLSSV